MDEAGLPTTIILDTILPASLSCLACLWMFFGYARLNKSAGLKLILILCLSDFIYHASVLLGLVSLPAALDSIVRFIVSVSFNFSTAWPPVIAFLVYRSSRQGVSIDTQKYMRLSLIVVMLLSASLTLIRNALRPHHHVAASAMSFMFMLISMACTLFCYINCILVIKDLARTMFKSAAGLKIRNLYIYSFMQLITICPITTYLFIIGLTGIYHHGLFRLFLVLLNLTGAVNVIVYFIMRKAPKQENNTVNQAPKLSIGSAMSSLETSLMSESKYNVL